MDTIDAKLLKDMFIAGADALDSKKEYVNDLTYFLSRTVTPGTNMTMTIQSAVREVKALTSDFDD